MTPGMSAALYVCLCVEGSCLWRWTCMQGLQKQRGYQIQTWAALLGLTNEVLLCLRQRNLQHPPFIYTGGLVCEWVCVPTCGSTVCTVSCFQRKCACVCDRGESQQQSRWGPDKSVWWRIYTGDGFNCSPKTHISTCFNLISRRYDSKWCEATRDFGSEHISPSLGVRKHAKTCQRFPLAQWNSPSTEAENQLISTVCGNKWFIISNLNLVVRFNSLH